MVQDLPRLFSSCWSMPYWSFNDMLECWTMFLVSMCMMARASDVTSFCPNIQDTELPIAEAMWDPDGYPKFIELGMFSWKWRSKKNQGKKRYPVRLHRNYVDARFCPVMWLLFYLSRVPHYEGPLFQDKVAAPFFSCFFLVRAH